MIFLYATQLKDRYISDIQHNNALKIELEEKLENLVVIGANIILVSCQTAHRFFDSCKNKFSNTIFIKCKIKCQLLQLSFMKKITTTWY